MLAVAAQRHAGGVDRHGSQPGLEGRGIAEIMHVGDQGGGDVLEQVFEIRVAGFVHEQNGRDPAAVVFPDPFERFAGGGGGW
mgnify:CR=1 FL=1